jgi:hypothetical protein
MEPANSLSKGLGEGPVVEGACTGHYAQRQHRSHLLLCHPVVILLPAVHLIALGPLAVAQPGQSTPHAVEVDQALTESLQEWESSDLQTRMMPCSASGRVSVVFGKKVRDCEHKVTLLSNAQTVAMQCFRSFCHRCHQLQQTVLGPWSFLRRPACSPATTTTAHP